MGIVKRFFRFYHLLNFVRAISFLVLTFAVLIFVRSLGLVPLNFSIDYKDRVPAEFISFMKEKDKPLSVELAISANLPNSQLETVNQFVSLLNYLKKSTSGKITYSIKVLNDTASTEFSDTYGVRPVMLSKNNNEIRYGFLSAVLTLGNDFQVIDNIAEGDFLYEFVAATSRLYMGSHKYKVYWYQYDSGLKAESHSYDVLGENSEHKNLVDMFNREYSFGVSNILDGGIDFNRADKSLIIVSQDLAGASIYQLRQYIAGGGSLLIFTDFVKEDILNRRYVPIENKYLRNFLDGYGLDFSYNMIAQRNGTVVRMVDVKGNSNVVMNPFLLRLHTFNRNVSYVEGLKELVLPYVSGLNTTRCGDCTPLFWSDNVGRMNGQLILGPISESNLLPVRYPLGVNINTKFGGKIYLVSDSDFIKDHFINLADNREFLENLVQHVFGSDVVSYVNSETRLNEASGLAVSDAIHVAFMAVLFSLVYLLVLYGGYIVRSQGVIRKNLSSKHPALSFLYKAGEDEVEAGAGSSDSKNEKDKDDKSDKSDKDSSTNAVKKGGKAGGDKTSDDKDAKSDDETSTKKSSARPSAIKQKN